jgi:hypothetical protein
MPDPRGNLLAGNLGAFQRDPPDALTRGAA